MNRIVAGSDEDYRWRPAGQAAADIEEQKHIEAQRVMVPADPEPEPCVQPDNIDEGEPENIEPPCQIQSDIGADDEKSLIDNTLSDGYIEDSGA